MAGSSAVVKVAAVLLAMAVVLAPEAEAAITCGLVVSKLSPCINYLRTGAGPPPPCCSGVKSLLSSATTPADRRTACGCLKQAASSSAIKQQFAAQLPGKCGVSIPYPISPSVDCSKVT
ncbi:hypothetical protein Syun_000084 [Stephania yunnanensis]|uniref:Non-specific lipid-transfer protein n=1 Tax=Stephania yunnanensis TaxID=152371 RepID=A0AAP0LGV1_9MAGN